MWGGDVSGAACGVAPAAVCPCPDRPDRRCGAWPPLRGRPAAFRRPRCGDLAGPLGSRWMTTRRRVGAAVGPAEAGGVPYGMFVREMLRGRGRPKPCCSSPSARRIRHGTWRLPVTFDAECTHHVHSSLGSRPDRGRGRRGAALRGPGRPRRPGTAARGRRRRLPARRAAHLGRQLLLVPRARRGAPDKPGCASTRRRARSGRGPGAPPSCPATPGRACCTSASPMPTSACACRRRRCPTSGCRPTRSTC